MLDFLVIGPGHAHVRQIDFVTDPHVKSVISGSWCQTRHEVQVIMRNLHPIRPEYLHRNLVNSVENVCDFFLVELFHFQVNGAWHSHEAVIYAVPDRVMQTFISRSGIDGKTEMMADLHKDEPRDLHFARIDFVPDKSLIFGVKMFDSLHDSPRDSHVAMIDFVPDPGMKLHVTRARSQRVTIMMSHLQKDAPWDAHGAQVDFVPNKSGRLSLLVLF